MLLRGQHLTSPCPVHHQQASALRRFWKVLEAGMGRAWSRNLQTDWKCCEHGGDGHRSRVQAATATLGEPGWGARREARCLSSTLAPHTHTEPVPPQATLASSGQAQSLPYLAQMPIKLTDGNRPKLWAARAHAGTTGPTVCRPC